MHEMRWALYGCLGILSPNMQFGEERNIGKTLNEKLGSVHTTLVVSVFSVLGTEKLK